MWVDTVWWRMALAVEFRRVHTMKQVLAGPSGSLQFLSKAKLNKHRQFYCIFARLYSRELSLDMTSLSVVRAVNDLRWACRAGSLDWLQAGKLIFPHHKGPHLLSATPPFSIIYLWAPIPSITLHKSSRNLLQLSTTTFGSLSIS